MLAQTNPFFLPLHDKAERDRILTLDYERNHQGREYSLAQIIERVDWYLLTGGRLFCAKNVMFMVKRAPDDVDTLEFHSTNGGSAQDLTAGINAMLGHFSPHFDRAVTYYDNPRVSDLAKHCTYKTEVARIDQGQDKTFSMTFNLRG
jgi:hypothetical protein